MLGVAMPSPALSSKEGIVLSIQRMSTEDGPGLRSTAFLKGCPLACAWCHNPESLDPRPQVQWVGLRCIAASTQDGCGACVAACPRGALSRSAEGILIIDRKACAAASGAEATPGAGGACGRCAEACPAGAVEILGTRMTAEALAAELLKDRTWFGKSDRGGITLSGGEASAQPGFALEVLRLCREAGVHTALDTCGVASWEVLERLYTQLDLVLYDLKESEPQRHKAFTGLDNGLVVKNLELTLAHMARTGRPEALWLRTPIVPGATDRVENLKALGDMVAKLARLPGPGIERWELCAFNNLCADKYRRLGLDWAYATAPLMTATDMSGLAAAARLGSRGLVEVTWTGSTRIEPERN